MMMKSTAMKNPNHDSLVFDLMIAGERDWDHRFSVVVTVLDQEGQHDLFQSLFQNYHSFSFVSSHHFLLPPCWEDAGDKTLPNPVLIFPEDSLYSGPD